MSDSDEIRKKKASRTQTSMLVWVLMAMLVTGLGGFGVTNFGSSVTSIGSVGAIEIEANDYARALRGQVNRLSQQFGQPLTLEQARAFGVDQQVLSQLLGDAALDNEALRIGLSVGDASLARQVAADQAFQDASGAFSETAYKFALEQVGLTARVYESSLRADMARSVLQAAIVGGTTAPAALTDALLAHSGELRGLSLVAFSQATLPAQPPAPAEADLAAYYQANLATFTRGEAKRISYVLLRPADLAATQTVPDSEVEALYQSRLSEFVIPERRLVERLVYPTEGEAQAAFDQLQSGTSFEALVAARKLDLEDIDLGDVAKADLGAAGDAVFALTEPGVVGPVQTDLGPALLRMNGILAAQETTLDQARAGLLSELQLKAAASAVADQAPAIDDALAGGATLEDLQKDFGMTLASLDYVEGADDNDPVTTDAAFAAAATALAEGDFPEALQLNDGAIAALRFEEILPPAPVPLDQIRDKVAAAWSAEQMAKAVTVQARAAEAALAAGSDLAAQGSVVTIAPVARDARPEGTTPDVMALAFSLQPGEVRLLDTPQFTGLVRLDSVTPVDPASDAAQQRLTEFQTRMQSSMANDAYDLFTSAMTAQGGIQVDQSVISAVQAQMQ